MYYTTKLISNTGEYTLKQIDCIQIIKKLVTNTDIIIEPYKPSKNDHFCI